MELRIGTFSDQWHGSGLFASCGNWLVALRWRWQFRFVRPPFKPGYARLYVGPLEVEHRKQINAKTTTQ